MSMKPSGWKMGRNKKGERIADPVGAWRNSAEPIHDTDLCKSVGGNEIFVQNGGAEATGAVSSDCYKRGLLQA